MKEFSLWDFVVESNHIEGIHREPTFEEMNAHATFMLLPHPKIKDLQEFVSIVAPGHVLRDKPGLNVRVGNHIAPSGGLEIRTALDEMLINIKYYHPWQVHVDYETLHPFTDGNGRSGRVLWLWQMRSAPLGFLHHFYYQTLENSSD